MKLKYPSSAAAERPTNGNEASSPHSYSTAAFTALRTFDHRHTTHIVDRIYDYLIKMAEESAGRRTEGLAELNRRKVRKGTKSCWECKRRKIRCTYVTPSASICDGCKSRRVDCIGQEFTRARVPANSKHIETSVGRPARQVDPSLTNLLPRCEHRDICKLSAVEFFLVALNLT